MTHEDTRTFITALYGKYFESNDGLIEIRIIGKDSGKVESRFFTYKDFEDNNKLMALAEENGYNHIYFGVNPRPLSKEKKQDDIKNIVCLWSDIDDKNFKNGRSEAEKYLKDFPVKPSMVIDSGHGLHCYWILKEPILNIDKNERDHLKQILSGIAGKLRADKQVLFLNCLLRLPGYLNIKDREPKNCKVIQFNAHREYVLEDFEKFRNVEYQEPEPADETTFDFGREDTVLISAKNQKDAFADIDKLEVTDETKMHIKTGAPLTKKGADDTRSARDMSIICALVSFDYNYKTIESIFLNPYLGCSNRIIGKGQKGGILALHWDVNRALKFVEKSAQSLTPERREYRRLKYEKKVPRQMKLGNCCRYVTKNLVSGDPPIGEYFKNDDEKARYYFDKKNKRLMDIKSTDFECFTRIRYGIQSDDWEEVKKSVRDVIWDKGKEIESHNTMYYDKKKDIIYYDNGGAGVYRLRDGKIELIDHGTDGIFFKTNTEYTPFELVDSSKVAKYFEREREPKITIKKIGTLKLPKRRVYGFDMVRFIESDSLLKKYLIDVCNFGMTEKGIAPVEQKFLLILYFYGLFFESIMSEKPIACFVGQKETGKSTIATLIGKILFGDKFLTRDFPENKKDMEVSMGNNYYLPLDNVDHNVPANMLDVLCQASTGGLIEKRKLWTDDESVKIRPRVWLIITTREAKFKRDDMISRLLLFDTKWLPKKTQPEKFYNDIEKYRNEIMTEIFVNLASIIKILKRYKDWHPDCTFRIAAWETFGRKVTRGSAWEPYYKCIIEEMNRAKDLFTLADDPLYHLLNKRVIEDKKPIVEETANELYRVLIRDADDLKMKSFAIRYPTVKSLSVKISHINNELSREFDFKKTGGSGHTLRYNFDRIGKDDETVEAVENVAKDVPVLTENQQRIADLKALILAKEKEEAESK